MIAVTVSGKAYGAIVAFLPSPSGAVQEIVPDREYLVWLPQAAVDHLRPSRSRRDFQRGHSAAGVAWLSRGHHAVASQLRAAVRRIGGSVAALSHTLRAAVN
jgi:hypothetical protein